jgi:hypothetical protein
LLDGADARGAEVYIHRARQRFEEVPINASGRRIQLALNAGVAEYNTTFTEVQEMLATAARDLHKKQRADSEPTQASPAPALLRRAS